MVLTRVSGSFLLALLLLTGCQSYEPYHPPVSQPAPAPRPQASPRSLPPAVSRPPAVSPAVMSFYRRGQSQAAQQQWQAVMDTAEQGLRIDRRFSGFYLLLAQAQEAQGQRDQALRFAEQAERLCVQQCDEARALRQRLAR